jgi:hypothetical protein
MPFRNISVCLIIFNSVSVGLWNIRVNKKNRYFVRIGLQSILNMATLYYGQVHNNDSYNCILWINVCDWVNTESQLHL